MKPVCVTVRDRILRQSSHHPLLLRRLVAICMRLTKIRRLGKFALFSFRNIQGILESCTKYGGFSFPDVHRCFAAAFVLHNNGPKNRDCSERHVVLFH